MGRRIFAIAARKAEVVSSSQKFGSGRLVLITNQHSPRRQWPMGIVEEVMADRNGDVRQATVRTARCILTRDITIALLNKWSLMAFE